MSVLAATSRFAKLLTTYADNDAELVIPEDLSILDDTALAALHEQAISSFDTIYGEGQNLSADDVSTLSQLTSGIEQILAEQSARNEAAAERSAAAAELAARVRPADQSAVQPTDAQGNPVDDQGNPLPVDANGQPVDANGNPLPPLPEGSAGTDTPEGDDEEEDPDKIPAAPVQPVGQPGALVSGGSKRRGPIRVNLAGLSSRQRYSPRPTAQVSRMQDVMLASDVPGFTRGQGMDWNDVGRAVDRRLQGYNHTQYENAARAGRVIKEQFGVAVVRKPFDPALVVQSNDITHVDEVLRRAMDEHRLPGGNLVASGGWCAPSETIYDLCELESRDGLFSLPEIGISRGGIQWTLGPDFSSMFSDLGWCYTEQEDIDGDYDGAGGGSKPCYRVECPPFQEERLGLCGLCIQAGLLMSKGYPEVIARTVRGALIAHDHKMSAKMIQEIIAGSTTVTMPAGQAGAAAPILTAIELQVEHFRYSTRISRSPASRPCSRSGSAARSGPTCPAGWAWT